MKLKINLLILALVDGLFLPFMRPLPFTLLLAPVLFWNFKNIKINIKHKEITLSIIFLTLAVASYIYSILTLPPTIIYDGRYINPIINNTFLLGLLIIFFAYLFLFIQKSNLIINKIYKILEIYLYFTFLLAFTFWYDYLIYFEIRSFWTLSGNSLSIGDFSSITRFTGTFSDPNNAAVAITMIYSTLLTEKNVSPYKFSVFSLIVFFIIISTMSTIGSICFSISFSIILLQFFYKRKNFKNLLLLFIIAAPLFYFTLQYLIESNTFDVYYNRVSENDASNRLEKINYYLSSREFLKSFIIGSGGIVFINEVSNKPHIGHLHLIFNYSIYSWVLFMLIIFRIRSNVKLKYYLPVLIFFLGFTTNTAIIDFRFNIVASAIIGLYIARMRKVATSPDILYRRQLSGEQRL